MPSSEVSYTKNFPIKVGDVRYKNFPPRNSVPQTKTGPALCKIQMDRKRPREEKITSSHEEEPSKRQKKGFSVGPANLPDGTYKRKVQKIKKDLIHKAKVRKAYLKIKEHELATHAAHPHPPQNAESGANAEDPSLEIQIHPQRRSMLERDPTHDANRSAAHVPEQQEPRHRDHAGPRRPRPTPFAKEAKLAEQRRAEAETRRRAREEANLQRRQKIAERERFRKAMARARVGGWNGQRKLGRESNVLLERVRQLMRG